VPDYFENGDDLVRWVVEVRQTGLSPRNLDDLLSGLGFRLLSGPTYPAITSAEMQNCTTAAEALEVARRIQRAMVGPARVDEDFRLGSVIDLSSDPPTRHAFVEFGSTAPMAALSVAVQVRTPKELSAEDLALLEERQAEKEYQAALERQRARLEPAYRNKNAEKVLEFLAEKQPSGETVNKVYELIEGHPGKRVAFHAKFGVAKTDFERFKDAVHNPRVTGEWARHAYSNPPKTADPMTKAEAEAFVRQLAEKWLDEVRRFGERA
jgi:hypothetical protein